MANVDRKVFNDAVHGAIALHPLCVRIIDTPQFQRLRFIKQLGCTYYVYPAASHNRFEHSIGVCYLAGELARSLYSKGPNLETNEREREKDILCVEIAGLCHDLGHGPFSHLWEDFMKRARQDSKWTHEEQSLRMFDHLLDDNDLRQELLLKVGEEGIKFIKDLMNTKDVTIIWPYEGNGRGKEKAFLYEIVSNKRSGVDVDKWDYFLRDSQTLGIKVTFDYRRLINYSRVMHSDGSDVSQICYRDKELANLYDMFHSRLIIQRTACFHRVAKTIHEMVVDAFIKADKYILINDINLGDLGKQGNEAAYTLLVDDVFNLILRDSREELKEARDILLSIQKRELYTFLGYIPQKTYANLETELADELDVSPETLDHVSITFDYGKLDKNPIENITFFNKAGDFVAKKQIEMGLPLLPQSFQEVKECVIWRYRKRASDKKVESVNNHFKNWAKRQRR